MASSVAETLRKAGQSLGRVLVIGGGEAAGVPAEGQLDLGTYTSQEAARASALAQILLWPVQARLGF